MTAPKDADTTNADMVSVSRGLLMEIDRMLTGLRHQLGDNEAARDRISEYQDHLREAYTKPGFRRVRG